MNHTKYLYSKDKTKHRKLYFIIVAIFAGQLFHTQAKESEFIFTCQPYLQQVSGNRSNNHVGYQQKCRIMGRNCP